MLVYYKDLGGSFHLGIGGEFGQEYFLASSSYLSYSFNTAFFPRGLFQVLTKLWGGGKGGGMSAFLELEAGYRLPTTVGSQSFASSIDLAGNLFTTARLDDMDLRIGVRGSLESLNTATLQQKNLTLSAVIAGAF